MRLPLFVFPQGFLRPPMRHEERLSHIPDSCRPPCSTRNEDKPDPCEVKTIRVVEILFMTPSFNAVELAAIARIAISMAEADGHVDTRELNVIGRALRQYGVPHDIAVAICAAAITANEANAIAVVSEMSMLQKADLVAWLMAVIVADGVIAESEIAKLRSLGVRCGFPTDVMEDALRKVKKERERPPVSSGSTGCLVPLLIGFSTMLLSIVAMVKMC